MTDSAGLQTERWAAGRRFLLTRPLLPEERAGLERERRSAIRRAVFLPIGYVVSAVLCVGLAWGLARVAGDSSEFAGALAAVLLMGALVWTGYALLRTRDWVRAARAAAKDLAAGTVDVFESSRRSGDPAASEMASPALAVTRGTGRAVGGPAGMLGRSIPVCEVAVGTEAAYRVPSVAHVEGADVEQRRLSESECEEIRLAITRARRLDSRVLLPVGIFACFGVPWFFATGASRAKDLGDFFTLALVAVVAAISVWRWVGEYRTSLQLQRDLEEGLALWIQPRDAGQAPVEILPHSRVLWWTGDSPAGWRSLGTRGKQR